MAVIVIMLHMAIAAMPLASPLSCSLNRLAGTVLVLMTKWRYRCCGSLCGSVMTLACMSCFTWNGLASQLGGTEGRLLSCGALGMFNAAQRYLLEAVVA